MPDTSPARMVPARYVGHAPVKLRAHPSQPYRDGEGRVREEIVLHPGDTLMIPETELRGETFLVDPQGLVSRAESLGPGFAHLPQHEGLSRDDLVGVRFPSERHGGALRQYEFHEGRPDFQDVHLPWPPPAKATPDADAGPTARASRRVDLAATVESDAGAGDASDAPEAEA